eukprot:3562314-Rhodomonas_salina.2
MVEWDQRRKGQFRAKVRSFDGIREQDTPSGKTVLNAGFSSKYILFCHGRTCVSDPGARTVAKFCSKPVRAAEVELPGQQPFVAQKTAKNVHCSCKPYNGERDWHSWACSSLHVSVLRFRRWVPQHLKSVNSLQEFLVNGIAMRDTF